MLERLIILVKILNKCNCFFLSYRWMKMNSSASRNMWVRHRIELMLHEKYLKKQVFVGVGGISPTNWYLIRHKLIIFQSKALLFAYSPKKRELPLYYFFWMATSVIVPKSIPLYFYFGGLSRSYNRLIPLCKHTSFILWWYA